MSHELQSQGRSTSLRVFVILLVLAAVGGGAWWALSPRPAGGGASAQGGKPGGGPGGPVPVLARAAQAGDLHVVQTGLGSVIPSNTITLHSRVSGELLRLDFHDGDTVHAGQVLAELDPRPYQVQLNQAEGQLAKDQAALAAAQVDLKRYRGLLAQDSIASQQVDTQQALVSQYEGAIKADQAAVASARLNLTYTRVQASVGGVVGLRQVDVGNVVNPSDSNGIVVINQVQPVYVVFTVTESAVPALLAARQSGAPLTVEAWDRDNKTTLASGHVYAIDNQIDTSTGTLKVRAIFDNADNHLFPNAFVNARLLLETRHGAVLIPAAAVQRGTGGTFVFVVDKAQKVAMRAVTLGPIDADQVQVLSGLAVGETVVVDGADKLKDGSRVTRIGPQPVAGSGSHAAGGWSGGGHHHSHDTAQ